MSEETMSEYIDRILKEDTPEGETMRAEVRNGADELEHEILKLRFMDVVTLEGEEES